jgi:hypothetical protein
MFHPDQLDQSARATPAPDEPTHAIGGCFQPGCPCRDGRIVSQRLVAFFTYRARRTSETADRVIAQDPDWTLPNTTSIH